MAGRPDNRFTRIGRRIAETLEYAFAQKRMFRDPYAGFFHILIFAGFVVLTVRSIALVLEGSIPGFVLLPGPPGDYYTLLKDVFEVLTLAGVLLAVFRRAFARPKRLDLSMDAWLILFLIGLLMATDLVAAGAQLALAPSLQTRWSPVVLTIARMLSGIDRGSLQTLYETCWWVHLFDLLFFGNYLPYSKHFHILSSIPNIFFMLGIVVDTAFTNRFSGGIIFNGIFAPVHPYTGSIFQADAHLDYYFSPNFGVGGGFSYTRFRIKKDDLPNVLVDFRHDFYGPRMYLTGTF